MLCVQHGVPQRSDLGPLLFLVMVNILCRNNTTNLIMYAGGVSFLQSYCDPSTTISSTCLGEAQIWFSGKGFPVNPEKKHLLCRLVDFNYQMYSV